MYSDPNEALSYWYSLYLEACWIRMARRVTEREFLPEWFNSEIQAAIATRNHLHRKAFLTNNALNWPDYCA